MMADMDECLVVGESLIDIVRRDGAEEEYVGGSAANVAMALARLGRTVRFATGLGDDARGHRIAEHLRASGVELTAGPGTLQRTSTAAATIAPDGAASYVFDLDWPAPAVPIDLDPTLLHVCSIGAVLAPGAAGVRREVDARRATSFVSYDINARPAITGVGSALVAQVEDLVGLCDLVKASDEDFDALWPGVAHVEVARRLLSAGPSAVVMTRGGDGALWVDRDGGVEMAAPVVEVADTIAAGDTFMAGLLDALWSRGALNGGVLSADHDDAEAALRAAVAAAAIAVSRPGADPPWRHELPD